MISLIWAMDKNNVIGYKNDMPWHLPNDLKFFKEKTVGNTIIMGRKTFESLGRVLPNRKHIVLTRGEERFPDGVQVMREINEIKQYVADNPAEEVFVIGGGHVFEQVLPFADRLYVTVIDEAFKGDVFFPEINFASWNKVFEKINEQDEFNPHIHTFTEYVRKGK